MAPHRLLLGALPAARRLPGPQAPACAAPPAGRTRAGSRGGRRDDDEDSEGGPRGRWRRRRPGPLPPGIRERASDPGRAPLLRREGPARALDRGPPAARTPATWSPSGAPPRSCCASPRPPCEVYNDLDGEVVGFFRVLRERPGELVEAVREHALRPRRDRPGVRARPAGPGRPGAGPAGVRAGLAGAPRPARPGPHGLALRAGGDRLPDGGRPVGRHLDRLWATAERLRARAAGVRRRPAGHRPLRRAGHRSLHRSPLPRRARAGRGGRPPPTPTS